MSPIGKTTGTVCRFTHVEGIKRQSLDYGTNTGKLCGSMANPMALNYANSTVDGDNPSVAYATVYPLSIFVRVISAQLIMLLLS